MSLPGKSQKEPRPLLMSSTLKWNVIIVSWETGVKWGYFTIVGGDVISAGGVFTGAAGVNKVPFKGRK